MTSNKPKTTQPIKKIDRKTTLVLGAAQVITSLGSAIKELIENSLDADADSITITLENDGLKSIEVADDGHGIFEDNFESLCLRYHTSKIEDYDDLKTVETLGFRGEALNALCAFSKMTVVTKHNSAPVGTKLIYDHNGNLTAKTPLARQRGTTVTLSDIFCTFPVRRKHLTAHIRTELSKMIQLITPYFLAYTRKRIICRKLTKNKCTSILEVHSNEKITDNIMQVFHDPKQVDSIQPFIQHPISDLVKHEYSLNGAILGLESEIRVSGYISKSDPGCCRSSADRQFFFLNQRPCEMKDLKRVVREFYKGQHPFVLLFIEIPKSTLDINLTPDKRTIAVQRIEILLAIVKSSLQKMFESQNVAHKLSTSFLATQESPTIVREVGLRSSSPADACFTSENTCTLDYHVPAFGNLTDSPGQRSQSSLDDSLSFEPSHLDSPHFQLQTNFVSSRVLLEQNRNNTSSSSSKLSGGQSSGSIMALFGNPLFKRHNTDESCSEVRTTVQAREAPKRASVDLDKFSAKDAKSRKIDNEPGPSQPLITDLFPKDSSNHKQMKSSDSEACTTSCSEESVAEPSRVHSPAILRTPIDTLDLPMVLDKPRDPSSTRRSELLFTSMASIRAKFKNLCKPIKSKGQPAFTARMDPLDNEKAIDEMKRVLTKDAFGRMTILGQFNQGFILTKLKNDIFIVDQHACDERYNFEDLMRTTVLDSQDLVNPVSLQLGAYRESIISTHLHLFAKNGFKINFDSSQPLGKRAMLVAVPTSGEWMFGPDDVQEIVQAIVERSGNLVGFRPNRVTSMLASRACRKSIMINDKLTEAQMKSLLKKMTTLDNPWHCAHNRPTIRHLLNIDTAFFAEQTGLELVQKYMDNDVAGLKDA